MDNIVRRGFIFPDEFSPAVTETTDVSLPHESLARNFVLANPELVKKFSKFSGSSYCDFLILEVGAIKVGNNLGSNKVICYNPNNLSPTLWLYVMHYQSMGYKLIEFSN